MSDDAAPTGAGSTGAGPTGSRPPLQEQFGAGGWADTLDVINTSGSAPPGDQIRAVRLRTTVFFLVVLVGLYTVAQANTPRAAVLVAFVVYVAAAVLWVRAQYVDALDGASLVPPRTLTWLVTCGGVAVAAVGFLLSLMESPPVRPGALIIPGALAAYFGVGHLISRSRAFIMRPEVAPDPLAAGPAPWWAPWRRWRWAGKARRLGADVRRSWRLLTVVLGALGLVLVCGLLLLGTAPMVVSLLLIVGGAAFIPWLVSLLSEHAINHFTADPRRLRRVLGWAGAIAAAALVVLVHAEWGGLATAAALVMLALGIALASSTLADIAAVLAVIAFMGVTPQQDHRDRPIAIPGGDDRILVALGDSYMSGEGASTFVAGTDEGGGNECRRARTAWSRIAGGQPPFDDVVSFACSGADSPNLRHAPGEGVSVDEALEAGFLAPIPFPQVAGERTQLDEYDDWVESMPDPDEFAPALVVLSIGGNDAGFSSIGLTCVVPGSCNAPETKALWGEGNLDRVENRLRQVYDEVADAFPSSPVAVIPYPNPIHASALTEKCSTALLEVGDATFVKNFLDELNARILATAQDYGFHYVDTMVGALEDRGLQLCDDSNEGRAGVNFIGIRSVGGLSEQRFNPTKWHHNSLHPNERGHAALHEAFQRWFDDHGKLAGLTPPRARDDRGAAPVSETSPRDGGCATYPVKDPEGCRAQSNAWAFGEAGRFAVRAGGLGAVIGVAGWLAAVAFFGWRRSRAQEQATA